MSDEKPQDTSEGSIGQSVSTGGLERRHLKALQRIANKRSCDFILAGDLEDMGYITFSGDSNDIALRITELGRTALRSNSFVSGGRDDD